MPREECPSSKAPVWEEQGHLQPASYCWRAIFFGLVSREKESHVFTLCWPVPSQDLQVCQPASPPADTGKHPDNRLLQVLHKYLFFSNPRGNRALPCQYQDPFHPREARQTDPCPIQESKSNITTEIPHKGVELLQDETQDSSGSSSGNPKGSGFGITCPRISSCLSLHLLHCPLRAQA